jgi:DtxR family Mn-dependent transcriptional regulator
MSKIKKNHDDDHSAAITHSSAHYLKAIRHLLNERGYARAVDVAEELDISRSAAHMGLKALKEKGMVIEDKRHFFKLPQEYEKLARRIEGNLAALETFFSEILGVRKEEAHETACRMEHQLSPAVSLRLIAFLKYLQAHPDGESVIKNYHRVREEVCIHGGNEDCTLCEMFDRCPLENFDPTK